MTPSPALVDPPSEGHTAVAPTKSGVTLVSGRSSESACTATTPSTPSSVADRVGRYRHRDAAVDGTVGLAHLRRRHSRLHAIEDLRFKSAAQVV